MTDNLLTRLNTEIDAAVAQNRVNPDTMFLLEARDEIVRLTVALEHCADGTERLFRLINETRGEKIEILRVASVSEKNATQ